MEISDIYVHDAQLHRVIEDIERKTVTFEVELPIVERNEEQQPRLLVFVSAGMKVVEKRRFENPFSSG